LKKSEISKILHQGKEFGKVYIAPSGSRFGVKIQRKRKIDQRNYQQKIKTSEFIFEPSRGVVDGINIRRIFCKDHLCLTKSSTIACSKNIALIQRKDIKDVKRKKNGKSIFIGYKRENVHVCKRGEEENGSSEGISVAASKNDTPLGKEIERREISLDEA
jgi:hypothetical protein